MSRSAIWIAALVGIETAAPAGAHHSYIEFDQQASVEIAGTLVAAAWQNPHTSLTVTSADGRTWDIETSPVNALRRADAPLDLFGIGSSVKVAGWPSRRIAGRMYGTNIRSSSGEELILFRAPPRWSTNAFGTERQNVAASAGAASAKTIFRSWGSAYARPGVPDDADASPGALWRVPLPLTEFASRAQAGFDAVKYNMTLGCRPKGMPMVINVPSPMDFVDRGEEILMRIEEFDTVRTIHMNSDADPAAQPKTRLGYSIGRWEGETLLVVTGSVETDYYTAGAPVGPSASFLERFTVSDDGSRLHYTLRITDPDSLMRPVEQKRSWIAVDEPVMPFNCVSSDSK